VSRRIAAGDTHLQLVEGTDLLGPSRVDGLVDGTHPNDLGFQWCFAGGAERFQSSPSDHERHRCTSKSSAFTVNLIALPKFIGRDSSRTRHGITRITVYDCKARSRSM
jgi:hypothetical protein